MKALLVALTLGVVIVPAFWPGEATARTTFYVDAAHGRDTYNGTRPTVDNTVRQGPWKSIARVRAQPLVPGDSILFKRGGIWRDTLTLSASGAPGRPITVGAYGTGPLPIVSGADVVTGWTLSVPDTQTYSARVAVEPAVVFFGAARGTRRARADLLAAANEWCWAADVLHVRSASDPGSTVEAGARGAAIAILGQSYITIQDVLLERTNGSGLYAETSSRATSNLVVERITTRDSRYAGMTFKNGHPRLKTTGVLISGNTAYGNGASGINVSEGVNDVTISRNVSHHNNWSGDLYQAGIRIWANLQDARNLVIEHNETYGMYFRGKGSENGHGIWVDEVANGAVVRYNYSHDNENAGIYVEHSEYVRVYYNLVVNNRDASIMLYRGVHHNEVSNNTIYGGGTGIRLSGDGDAGSVTMNLVRNNISVGPTGQRLMAGDGGENDGRMGSGNVYLYNSLGPERPGFIVWGYHVTKSTYREWDAAYGGATHSVPGDPLFVNAKDFRLRADSPCVRAGVDVGLATDILGAAVPVSRPDVGAYQTQWSPASQRGRRSR